MLPSERMSPLELRASIGLASIYGLRMLGMFLILPVFAVYAEHLPGGQSHTLIGIALGMYGLTQAILQLPFGMASDHFGRKRVIYFGLLLFALGSFNPTKNGDTDNDENILIIHDAAIAKKFVEEFNRLY